MTTAPPIAIVGTRGVPATYGGFETSADQLSRRWAAGGHEVLVYARRNRYRDRPRRVGGVDVRYVPALDGLGLETPSSTLLAVADVIARRRRYRWVHLYNTGNAFLLPLLRLAGHRTVISVDGVEWRRDKWQPAQKLAHKLGERLAVRFAHRVVADNQAVADYYRQRYGAEAAVIAYGAEPVHASEQAAAVLAPFGLEAGRYFLFVGRLVPEKGVHALIEAYRRLRPTDPLVIVGDDKPGPYRDRLWAQGSDDVRFLGYQYGEAYEQLLANARMYLSASSLEGTSPSLLAAMSAGVCCLVNGIPENRITSGGSVEVYEQHDIDDLVRRWQALIDDPERSEAQARRGQEHQRLHYEWDHIAKQYIDLFWSIDRT